MRRLIPLLAFAATLALPNSACSQTLTGVAKWADSARVLIETSVIGDSPGALDTASILLDRALTVTPNDYLLLHYKGYTLYRQAGLSIRNEKKDDAVRQYAEADSVLERSSTLHPLPETFALLASIAGHRASLDPPRAITYGMRSNAMQSRAMQLGPDNPRVAVLKGTGALYGPAQFTGGLPEAIKQFRRAREIFAHDAPPPPLPAWGRAEAAGFLALALHQTGDDVGALAAAEDALAVAPGYRFVKYKILPMLGRKPGP